jgi:hypothetical protein
MGRPRKHGVIGGVREVNPRFVEEQPRVPFDFAQGRLSTAIGAQYGPISAQDDSYFLIITSGSEH